jgi:hypothetical protein
MKKVKKVLIIFLIPLLISCESKSKSENSFDRNSTVYTILNYELDSHIEILNEQINNQITSFEKKNLKVKKFDSITKKYFNYLESIITELIKKSEVKDIGNYENHEKLSSEKIISELFFENEKHTLKGEQFLSETKSYSKEILKMTENPFLKKRIENTVSVYSVYNEKGKEIYLNYHFNYISLISAITQLKNKQRNILEFENEFLSTIKFEK